VGVVFSDVAVVSREKILKDGGKSRKLRGREHCRHVVEKRGGGRDDSWEITEGKNVRFETEGFFQGRARRRQELGIVFMQKTRLRRDADLQVPAESTERLLV